MEITPEQVAAYLKETRPGLIKQLVKQADPGLHYLLEICEQMQYGKVELNITVRAGLIEGVETTERKKWLRQLDPKPTT